MSRRFIAVLVLGLSVPALAGTVEAQARLGIAAGVALPSGDFADGTNTGVNIEGNVEVRPGDMPFAIRGDLFLSRFGIDDDTGEDGSIRAFGAALSGLFQLVGAGITPYLLTGPTVTNLDLDLEGTDDEAELGTNFGVQAGVGAKMLISNYLTRFEVRFTHIFSKDRDAGIPSARWITVNAGMLFGGRGE